ncbi:MAG TPA: M23 family metallopeptidase [Thiolinea sp.]|nr:M23 family metallopeptidase [Thiolinea sp.]
MERYNLPVGGIEIPIGSRETAKLDEVNAITSSSEVRAQINQRQQSSLNKAKSPKDAPLKTHAKPNTKASTPRKVKPLRYLLTRSLVVVSVLAALGNIPVHSTVLLSSPNDDSELAEEAHAAVLREVQNTEKLNLPTVTETYAGYEMEPLPSATNGDWSFYPVVAGTSIQEVLSELNVSTDLAALNANPENEKILNNLQAGNKVFVQVGEDTVKQIIYATGKRTAYIISLQDGKYTGHWDNEVFEEQNNRIAFTIHNPLHYEATKAGLPLPITRQLSKVFKDDLNFKEIAIGDQLSVIFEDFYYQSERIFSQNVLAAEFNHKGQIYQRIRFDLASGKTRYLKPDAENLELKQVAFNRTPLNGGGRLSSGFGSRVHPVFGFRRMHTGTDFAAPYGTPIYATGDGTVQYVGRKGGYGKIIELSHGDGISTLYGHMSDYQKGLADGDSVKRGDVIGYVGSTGTSTGNHVHYEFKVNGEPQDPMLVALPEKGVLSPAEMQDFKEYARNLTSQLIKLRETASIERNVRQEFGG